MSDGSLRFSLNERKPGTVPSTGSSGNQVTVSNLESFDDAVKNVHNENNQTNWILVGYDGSADKIKLLSTGTGGINELINHFDDSEMLYAILRVVDIVDNIPTIRFVYITFIGDNVKAITKAKYGTNKTSITKLLGHYNVEIIASNKSELTETEIMNKIQDASGSRNRTGDIKPTSNPNIGTNTSSVKPSNTKTSGTTHGVSGPTVNTKSVGLTFNNESEIRSVIQSVKNPSDPTNWMLIGYEGKDDLGLVAKGTGGLPEMVNLLNSSANKVLYGILSTFDKFDEVAQSNIKVCQVTFVGVSVSPLVKGRLTTHRGTIDALFSPCHFSLFSETPSQDLTEDILASKVQQLKGSKTN